MVSRQAGITFVELMIVVAIIGLLAVVATPFASEWMGEADINNARSSLSRAHSQAKSVALRNPDEVTGNSVAASVKRDGSLLLVCEGVPNCTANTAVWQSAWPSSVTLTLSVGADIRLNNRGQILNGTTPASAGLTYTLLSSKGNVSYGGDDEDNRLR